MSFATLIFFEIINEIVDSIHPKFELMHMYTEHAPNRKLPLNDVRIPVFRVGEKYRYHRLRIYRICINILYK